MEKQLEQSTLQSRSKGQTILLIGRFYLLHLTCGLPLRPSALSSAPFVPIYSFQMDLQVFSRHYHCSHSHYFLQLHLKSENVLAMNEPFGLGLLSFYLGL